MKHCSVYDELLKDAIINVDVTIAKNPSTQNLIILRKRVLHQNFDKFSQPKGYNF